MTLMIDLANDLNADYKDWFYHGGEEYELLFAADPSIDICVDNKPNLIHLGRFTSKQQGVMIINDDGDTEELQMKSWDHL